MRLTRGCRAGGGVACSSLEYGGIRAATRRTPAPHDRLLLPTSPPPPPRSLLFVHLRFPPSSPSRLLLLYSPRNIGAVLLLPPAASSYPLPTLRRQQRRRRCSHFSSKALPSRCSSSKAIEKMDRRKKTRTGSRDGEEKNRIHPLSRIMHKEDTLLLCFPSAANFVDTINRYIRLINS